MLDAMDMPCLNAIQGLNGYYLYAIALVKLKLYKDDSIEDAVIIAATAMQESMVSKVDVISGIEVFTQDADFDLSDDELALL